MLYPDALEIAEIIKNGKQIVILQADNPDGDSLASSLALEQILHELGKEPYLYCAVDMPTYLRYLSGWDRVQKDLPKQFDASIIVDASTMTLFERLAGSGQQGWLAGKPCVVLDHHETVDNVIPFAEVLLNDPKRSSTGELIYKLVKDLGWPLSVVTQEFLMTSILGDTQGLTNQLASAETYRIMAAMVEAGVDRPKLEELRREYGKMPPEIFRYKAELIKRTEFAADGRIATVSVPQTEINNFSPLYNPAPLIQNDMLQVSGVQVAIVFKAYDDGRVTGAIRCNPMAGIGAELASHFGGGGHAFASGFKVTHGRSLSELKSDCVKVATGLLNKLENKD
ncbi:MAG TPA: DHH family phosphoesterase [Candidatus Saccharimonadales bacterium]|nr:DHH family phosphoesterase [Candidatus Saccharimonadales bacterium]